MRLVALASLVVVVALAALAAPPGAHARPAQEPAPHPDVDAVQWRASRALGAPALRGRLVHGVQLPEQGIDFFTWNGADATFSNPGWRRWGTDRLVRTLLTVITQYRADNPDAPRVAIGDLSRRHGGGFGRRYGGLGHASHQNGLDADVYYPRLDRREKEAARPQQVDQRLAQDLVDRFVAAGALYVFVGPRLQLHGPRRVVIPLVHHDDHLHVRIR